VTAGFAADDPMDRDEYTDTVGAEVDTMLYFVYGMLGVAVIIALMGIANTLSLSIHERRRELGLSRAVGQSRSQLRSTVRWESVIIAVFGTIGGISLGGFLGWGIVRALEAQEGFGVFALPIVPLAVILGLAAAAGVVAAVRPARRAAKTDILTAIASD
jgi:putative ABC transport system permease protein